MRTLTGPRITRAATFLKKLWRMFRWLNLFGRKSLWMKQTRLPSLPASILRWSRLNQATNQVALKKKKSFLLNIYKDNMVDIK